MNEKKLTDEVVVAKNAITDEEIVKALEICYNTPCCTNDCPYFNKNGRNFCMEGKAFYKNLEDLINRQKAEIERLTEEKWQVQDDLDNYHAMYQVEVKAKAELQKQVDELTDKLGKVLLGVQADELLVAKGIEQSVKDTAKEILTELVMDGSTFTINRLTLLANKYDINLREILNSCYGK